MTTPGLRAAPDQTLQVAPIAVLAVSAFVFVTAETLPVGLLPQIAHGLSVSEADVGLLLTTYAAVAALSTIPLTALTLRLRRDHLLALLMTVFAVSQVAGAVAPTFGVLIATRLVCALAHGVFWSAIAPAAARLAPPGQSGRATSLAFVGIAAALVLGVPLSTALGQAAGWRTPFVVLAAAGTLSAGALLRLLPRLDALPEDRAAGTGTRLRAAGAAIWSRSTAPVCAVTAVFVIGQFAAYTYIAPLVRHGGGLSGFALSALLLGYGATGLLGNVVVGRVVDAHPGLSIAGCVLLVATGLTLLAVLHGAPITVVAVLLWGLGATAVPVCLQAAVLRVAPDNQEAASAVYVVAFQIGIGGGSFIGDRFVAAGHLPALPVFGSLVALAAGVVVLTSRRAFPR
ncbi:MFS transporter [Acidothermaceae bacterium B102]|nr:MFS transporter [Acidothermaceae bacterium B102]